MTRHSRLLCIAFGACAFGIATLAHAQATIPVRKLTPPVATDSGVLRSATGIRHLPGDRLLVNDAQRKRMLVFDSTLKTFTVTADTSDGAPAPYGTQQGGLMAYLGDSTAYLDLPGGSATGAILVIIDPAGKITHPMAVPKPSDWVYLMNARGFDPKGRLIYQSTRPAPPSSAAARDTSGKPVVTSLPDSAPILRADFDTRTVDTIATFGIPAQKRIGIYTATGSRSSTALNPMPQTDDWALLPDGTLAIVRGHDYHIDWVHMDGTRTSTPKMPFDWKPVTLEDKQRMIDSTRQEAEKRRANAPPPRALPDGGRSPFAAPPGPPLPIVVVEPSEMPDYYPPIRRASVKADLEGNVWIPPTTSVLAGAGLAYDVVNRKGEIFERVVIPQGRVLVGFGPGGIVYMTYTPALGQTWLERARIIR